MPWLYTPLENHKSNNKTEVLNTVILSQYYKKPQFTSKCWSKTSVICTLTHLSGSNLSHESMWLNFWLKKVFKKPTKTIFSDLHYQCICINNISWKWKNLLLSYILELFSTTWYTSHEKYFLSPWDVLLFWKVSWMFTKALSSLSGTYTECY